MTLAASSLSLRALLVVAVFAGVGPPVGGLVAWLTFGLGASRSPAPFMAGSYAEGVLLATATGIIVVVARLALRRTTWLTPVLAAILSNLAFHGINLARQPSGMDGLPLVARLAEAFLLPSIVAALVCWWLTRKLLDA
jgi:hypothetical protein